MKKRVLVSGASGHIGSGTLAYLLEHTDWNFTCVCSWRHHGKPENIEPSERVEVVTHDLRGPIPDLGAFDHILHLAAISHVDTSILDPVGTVETNVSSTLQMLEYARRYPPETFISFGTDEVFGANAHEEWDVLLPANPYAASKAAAEMVSISYWYTFGLPVILTNSNNILGPNQHREKYLPKLVDLISRGKTVQIHVYQGKAGRRFYNPVQNVADALLFILEHPEPRSDRPARYNIPGGEELDNYELACRVADILGEELHYELVDAESVRPGYDEMYPRTEGRLTELGWKPPFSLDEELPKIVHALKEKL